MLNEPLSFMARLKRHHIFRVASVYAIAAWVLIQLANNIFPDLGWPRQSVLILIVAVALLFPVVLVLSWMLIPPSKEDLGKYSRWHKLRWRLGSVLSLIIILLVTVSGTLLWRANVRHMQSQEMIAVANAPSGTSVVATAIPAKSIAVLPFENLSADKNNAYFADGMQEMILTKLADIGDLKVIARTSTMQYGSHPEDLKTIGQQLGVANILEGSVQKAGNQVLINVQMINVATNNHLWAEAYQRNLDNIFGVEGEVAEKVAATLDTKLSAAEQVNVAAAPTTDATAFNLYLLANAYANRAYDQDSLSGEVLPQAITLYQQAIAHDPHFALAAAALARAHMWLYWFGPDRTEARLAAASSASERALALEPNLGPGHFSLALYYYWGHRDYVKALAQLELARTAMPNSADVEMIIASIERRKGLWDRALAGYRQAAVLDPRNTHALNQLGLTYGSLRRYAEADVVFAQALTATGDPADELLTRATNTVLWTGDLAPLRAALEVLTPGTDTYINNASTYYWYDWLSRDYPVAIQKAQSDTAAVWSDEITLPRQLYLAWAYTAVGDSANAKLNYSAVQKQMRAALAGQPDDADLHLALAFADAGLGQKSAAVSEGRKAASLMPVSRDAINGTSILGLLAQLYVRVGDNRHAIEILRQLLAMPAGLIVSLALLKLDTVWDPIRKDPRFQALLKKYRNSTALPATTHGG